MAHAGETHLFLEKIFDLQSPSWPWRNPNWKTQAWIKCAGDTSNSSNWNHFKVLKFKNPLFIFKQCTIFTSDWIYLRNYLNPWHSNVFLLRSPFWTSTNSLTPFLNFSPHLLHTISHWAMIMMRKDVSADDPMQILHLYREVLSWNNLGELQKLLPPSVSTFDIWLMDSKFRNFPPLLFHPPRQNRLAKKPSWAARHNLNKNWAKPAKCGDLLLTSQLIPAPLGGSRLRRWSVLWNILNANTQLNKMN